MKQDDRGFYEYGDVTDDRGTTATVKESSAADGPYCWVFIKEAGAYRPKPGKSSLHVNESQARELVEALTKWLDQIPSRWAQGPTP